jgi:hypothetical protein
MPDESEPIVFPESRTGLMCAVSKGANTEIPADFPITKCPPSHRGLNSKRITRPRKGGKILSWQIAEALAPDAKLSYDEQETNSERRFLRHLSPKEAALLEVQQQIQKLKRENKSLREE